jgi:uncharacterized protein YgbK (DUF1537 family)
LRHDQVFLQVEQCAEGCSMDRRLAHRDHPIADIDAIDAEDRPAMAQPRAGNQLAKGCYSPLKCIARQSRQCCVSAAAAKSAIARTGRAKSE